MCHIAELIGNSRNMQKDKNNKEFWQVRNRLLNDQKIKQIAIELDFEYKLHQVILQARAKSGMTQAEIAEKLGTGQSVISRYEAGGSNPSVRFIQRLVEVLGLKIRIELY